MMPAIQSSSLFLKTQRALKTHLAVPAVMAAALLCAPALHADEFADHFGFLPEGPTITSEDVKKAQKAWGDAVVTIGKSGNRAPAVAEEIARSAYAFDLGPIQFKPTLAATTTSPVRTVRKPRLSTRRVT